ncbi:MAG: twin-arginine translocase TatA/TatE family subunit [Dehalococcoidia bacterium]|jgi:sec-independent protein translocase protein TatA
MDIGPVEILVVLLVVAMIFGVGKVPEIGSALGKSIREFRSAIREEESHAQVSEVKPEGLPSAAGVVCASCGAANATDSRFCTSCGSMTGALLSTGVACPICGVTSAANAKFCTSCGSSLSAVSSH